MYNKYFEDHYNLVSKLPHLKKGVSPEEAFKKISSSFQDLELIRMQSIDCLNEIIIHTKIDLIDKVCVCIYSFGSFFKQGSSMFSKLAPQLHSSTKRVAARANILKQLKVQLDGEREKWRKEGESKEINERIKDKEGFVFKQNSMRDWLLRFLIVRDQTLFMVKKVKKTGRYDYNNATFFAILFLAKIRKSSEYPDLPVFEIVSVKDNKTFILMVESFKEMEEWIQVLNLKVQRLIENPIYNSSSTGRYYPADSKQISEKQTFLDKNTEIISYQQTEEISEKERKTNEEIKQLIDDNIWADCKKPFPEWFSYNLGVLICISCSGYHRGLTTDVTRVKSLTLDTPNLKTLGFLKSVISNEINRKVFESKTASAEKDRK